LAALLHGALVVGVSQTAAFNRGRHLHSAGQPSRWALAHISSFLGRTFRRTRQHNKVSCRSVLCHIQRQDCPAHRQLWAYFELSLYFYVNLLLVVLSITHHIDVMVDSIRLHNAKHTILIVLFFFCVQNAYRTLSTSGLHRFYLMMIKTLIVCRLDIVYFICFSYSSWIITITSGLNNLT